MIYYLASIGWTIPNQQWCERLLRIYIFLYWKPRRFKWFFICCLFSNKKIIIKLSLVKIDIRPLEYVLSNIYYLKCRLCGPFKYFVILIDASTIWSHVCLLSIRSLVFARFCINNLNESTFSRLFNWS